MKIIVWNIQQLSPSKLKQVGLEICSQLQSILLDGINLHATREPFLIIILENHTGDAVSSLLAQHFRMTLKLATDNEEIVTSGFVNTGGKTNEDIAWVSFGVVMGISLWTDWHSSWDQIKPSMDAACKHWIEQRVHPPRAASTKFTREDVRDTILESAKEAGELRNPVLFTITNPLEYKFLVTHSPGPQQDLGINIEGDVNSKNLVSNVAFLYLCAVCRNADTSISMIMGDLNIYSDDAKVEGYLDCGIGATDGHSGTTKSPVDNSRTHSRLDRCYAREGFNLRVSVSICCVEAPYQVSDHCALVVDVNTNSTPSSSSASATSSSSASSGGEGEMELG